MTKPTIDECIAALHRYDFDRSFVGCAELAEILRILRAVKDRRELWDQRSPDGEGGKVSWIACDGREMSADKILFCVHCKWHTRSLLAHRCSYPTTLHKVTGKPHEWCEHVRGRGWECGPDGKWWEKK